MSCSDKDNALRQDSHDGKNKMDDGDPMATEIMLPSDDFIVDHWTIGSGSSVRKGETICFVCRNNSFHEGGTNTSYVPSAPSAPVHKRPSRRRRLQRSNTGSSANESANSKSTDSSTTTTTTITSMKERLATKLAAKKSDSTETDDRTSAHSSEGDTITLNHPKNFPKREMIPIQAPLAGILRIDRTDQTSTDDNDSKKKLVIGYIEECLHPTFLEGMCVVCGTPVSKSIDKIKSVKGRSNDTIIHNSISNSRDLMNGEAPSVGSSRDSINTNGDKLSQVTVSGGITMTVSERESQNMAMRDSERLFNRKKLSLVLDLDHTLVHATSDIRARQYTAENDSVRCILLPMFEGADPGMAVNPEHANMRAQHFVKLRPHINELLEGVQDIYEVTVYTAGTRQYAEEITMVLSRSMVGSKLDLDDLERLRYQVKLAENEYAKLSCYQEENTEEKSKKRKAEVIEESKGQSEGQEDVSEPSKKKKKVSFGFSENGVENNTQKSDHITKEKLEAMQAELQQADAVEQKARELRQKIFGSRVFSRTDVGDLGRDVKSLKRIFPCGGTMAAVVDDREDVWANAKDNSINTVKGEPPENLLLVRPYHWQPFVGFADINNAAGADLSGSKLENDVDPDSESDCQLLWTKQILKKLHERYYRQSAEGMRLSVPETLKRMRREVLDGFILVLSGLVPLHKQFISRNAARRPIVRYAQSLGAKTQDAVKYGVTHVVAAKDGTDKAVAARKTPGCVLVKPAWLMECYWSMSRRDVTPFLMGKGSGVPPTLQKESIVKESSLGNSSEGSSNESEDDFAADFENELMET